MTEHSAAGRGTMAAFGPYNMSSDWKKLKTSSCPSWNGRTWEGKEEKRREA